MVLTRPKSVASLHPQLFLPSPWPFTTFATEIGRRRKHLNIDEMVALDLTYITQMEALTFGVGKSWMQIPQSSLRGGTQFCSCNVLRCHSLTTFHCYCSAVLCQVVIQMSPPSDCRKWQRHQRHGCRSSLKQHDSNGGDLFAQVQ